MKFIVEEHAVERFIERIDPSMSAAVARAKLEAHIGSAAKLKQKTHSGEALYQIDALRCRVVVRPTRWGGDGLIVITTLPLDEIPGDEILYVEELAMAVEVEPPSIAAMVSMSVDERIIYCGKLSREQILELKEEAKIKKVKAIESKCANTSTHLNAISTVINAELNKRPASPVDYTLIDELRHALAEMLFKYGWSGNEAVREVYDRAKRAVGK